MQIPSTGYLWLMCFLNLDVVNGNIQLQPSKWPYMDIQAWM